jgi:hypothetical protein
MAPKKITLPPKPVAKERKAPTSQPVVPQKSLADLSGLKAVSYAITLDDGSVLKATGEHADLIYRYLTQCEKFCAEQQLVNYLGPSLSRYDQEGNLIVTGATDKPGMGLRGKSITIGVV